MGTRVPGLICLLFATLICFSQVHSRPLVVAKVSDNPKKHFKFLKPMADYLASRLTQHGITEGKVLFATDNSEMLSFLESGEVDLVTETIFSAVMFQDGGNAEFLLKQWKKGISEYHSVIFVRKDSGINSLKNLVGKTIGFEDPGSSSAFFIPAAALLEKGFQMVQLSQPRKKPPAGKIGYVFTHEEVNTSVMVHRNIIDAGAYNNLDWEKFDDLPKSYRDELKIIYRSRPFPRSVQLVRASLAPALKGAIKDILLNMHQIPEAESVLKSYQKTSRFEAFDDRLSAVAKEVRTISSLISDRIK